MALQGLVGLPVNPSFGLETNLSQMDRATSLATATDSLPLTATYDGTRLANAPGDFSLASMPTTDDTGRTIAMHFNKGTTTLAFKYQGGLVVCADSRATGGDYIGSGEVRKIIPINRFILGTMAGGAADCTYWERVLSERCRIYELRNRERISVAAASKLLSNMLYNYKGMGLSLGVMICGYDDKKGGSIFFVDNDGNRVPGKLFSIGSGSTYAYGVLDSGYRWDMEKSEAEELGRRAIYHATHRDAASGGVVRVYHVNEDGWEIISEEDCTKLHYERYIKEKEVLATDVAMSE